MENNNRKVGSMVERHSVSPAESNIGNPLDKDNEVQGQCGDDGSSPSPCAKIDKNILSWLTTVPASDINFKTNLQNANLETLQEALKKDSLSKLARKSIESKIKKLQRCNDETRM